jgi:hypothetical protein
MSGKPREPRPDLRDRLYVKVREIKALEPDLRHVFGIETGVVL